MVHALARGLAAAAILSATPAAAETLLPHRAVYDLNLVRSGASASMVSAKGRLVYELSGAACAGYGVNSRFVTRIVDREGMTRTTDVRSQSTETVDPPTYSFTNEEFIDGGLTSVVRGRAEGRGDGIAVTLDEPKSSEVTLPRAVFPTAHTLLTIEAGRNGDRVIEAPIYDGGDEADRSYQTTSVIGPSETGLPGAAEQEKAALTALPGATDAVSRHYVVSYFDLAAGGEPTPSYILTFEMLDNGVSYAAQFDYGDFVLSATLAELSPGEPAPCAADAPAPTPTSGR